MRKIKNGINMLTVQPVTLLRSFPSPEETRTSSWGPEGFFSTGHHGVFTMGKLAFSLLMKDKGVEF